MLFDLLALLEPLVPWKTVLELEIEVAFLNNVDVFGERKCHQLRTPFGVELEMHEVMLLAQQENGAVLTVEVEAAIVVEVKLGGEVLLSFDHGF